MDCHATLRVARNDDGRAIPRGRFVFNDGSQDSKRQVKRSQQLESPNDSNRSGVKNAECADISRGEFVLCEQALTFAVERTCAALVSRVQNRPRDGGDGKS